MGNISTVQENVRKKVLESLKNQKPTCGECVGLNCEIVKGKKLCSATGSLETSASCPSFKPNTNALIPLVEEKEDVFLHLSHLMNALPESKLRLIGAMFMREHATRNMGFKMGQKVYIRYRGAAASNFVSNFMSAYILYADAEMVRVVSQDGKFSMTFVGKARSAIFKATEFKAMRSKMIKAGKFVDPDVHALVSKRLRCVEEYNLDPKIAELFDGGVPTIDSVFKESGYGKRKKKGDAEATQASDLTAIARAIAEGYEVNSKGKIKAAKVKKSKSSSLDFEGNTTIDVTN